MSMYGFGKELKEAVHAFISFKRPFSIDDVKEVLDKLVKQRGSYKDPITIKKLKPMLVKMLEEGDIPGYCLIPKPVVDDNGPRHSMEFVLYNTMTLASIEMLELPVDHKRVSCRVHSHYKQVLKVLAQSTNMSQDMVARSILTRGLQLVFDQLK